MPARARLPLLLAGGLALMLSLSQQPLPWPLRASFFAGGLALGASMLTRPRAPRLQPILWLLLWSEIANLVWRYVYRNALPYFRLEPAHFGYLWANRLWLLAHIVGGLGALVAGPLQFWSGLRARHFLLHRRIGYFYVLAVSAAALCSFRLAFYVAPEEGGGVAGVSMAVLGGVWLATVGFGLRAIWQRQLALHLRWMVRSYAVTLAFVNLRWFVEFPWVLRLGPTEQVVPVVIWASWLLPLAAVEIAFRWPND